MKDSLICTYCSLWITWLQVMYICDYLSWTTLAVHNRDWSEIQGKNLMERTQPMSWKQHNAFILWWKAFCGILLCCLDALQTIKRNGIEFHDFWTDCEIYPFLNLVIIIITSTSDLQPSTSIANQLPGQLVFTQIRTIGVKVF